MLTYIVHVYIYTNILTYSRVFLSAGSPAFLPSKSRLVEALLIIICDKHPNPVRGKAGGARTYTSRWKLILTEYAALRSRLFNSQPLMEGTGIFLFPINETTLKKWYKDNQRRNEVKQLLQGAQLPQREVSQGQLPPNVLATSAPQPPPQPHVHTEPEDTTSQARVRKSRVHKQRKTATVSQPPMDYTSLSDADAFQDSHSDLSEAQLMTTSQTPLVSRSLPGTLQSTSHSSPPTPAVSQAPQLSAGSLVSPVPQHYASSLVPQHSAAHSPSLLSTGSTSETPQTITTHQVSRTTKWRRSKNPRVQQRKVYLCKHCEEPTAGTVFLNYHITTVVLLMSTTFNYVQVTLKKEDIAIVPSSQARFL